MSITILDQEYEQYGEIYRPFSPLIYKQVISDDMFDSLKQSIDNAHEDYRHTLAGNIADERKLEIDDVASTEINERVALYLSLMHDKPTHHFPHYLNGLNLNSIWVNFQKAFEWNPPHKHEGDISFVIYIDNPVDITEEEKHPTQQGNAPTAGRIAFRYGEQHNLMSNVITMSPKAKDMLIFPAWLEHQVYPFTQENITRISIAGNISIGADNTANISYKYNEANANKGD